ncbi:MAG: hypothetical protein RL088_2445 [Verrucomicrobiota bacterium]
MKSRFVPSHSRPTSRGSRAVILATSIASLFATGKAVAANDSWTGATDGVWATAGNWLGGNVPGAGDIATFNGASANTTIDLGAGVTIQSLAFDTAAVANYTVGAGAAGSQTLTLGNAGSIVMLPTATTNQLVNASLVLGTDGSSQTFAITNGVATNQLTIAGGISGSTGSGAKTISLTGSGVTTFSGPISNGTGGTVGISLTGTGHLNLSNTGNTFSGGVTIGPAAGTVTATTNNGTNASGLGTGAVSIGGGSTVNLLSANTVATATTLNNTFTGSGLLKLTFTGTTATNTILNGISGFTGAIQLANAGINADKLNTNANMGNMAASLTIDNDSQLFVTGSSTTNFNGGISIIGTGNSENRGVIRLGVGVLGGNISLAGSSTIGMEGGILAGNISATGTNTLTFGTANSATRAYATGIIGNGAGTLALTKVNGGTLWLSGANTYTGATTISAGSLQLGIGQDGGTTGSLSTNSAIGIASGANLIFGRSNAIALGTDFGAISGAGNVAQNGTGTTTFAPSATMAYTGQTQVNRGTLALDFANMATPTDLINATSILNLGGGTLSILGKNTGTTAQTFASTTFSPGRSVVSPNRNGGTSTTVSLGALTNGPGSAVHFIPATAWAAGANATTPGVASTTEIVTVASVTRNGTAITMPTTGYVFIGANMFNGTGSGARYVVAKGAASGPYQLVAMPTSNAFVTTGGSASLVYNIAAAQTLTGAVTNYALIGNSTGAVTLTLGANAYTSNGFLNAQTGTITISGAGGLTIGAEKDFVVNNANTGGLTISAVIANNGGGASSITNSSTGTGILTLSGANTYTGSTYFNSGTTSIATDGAASAASPLGTVPAAATPGNLVFNGGTLRFVPTAAATLNANRGITLGASGGTITNTAAFAVTISPIIAGIGGLTLSNTSTNTLVIGGANTFTGGATLTGTGLIVANNNAAFGAGGILTLNGAPLRAATGANISLANPVNIAADTTFPTTGTEKSLIFNGPATLSGTRTLTSAVGTTVGGVSVQFNNAIGESTPLSGLVKAGAGELVLGGLNTFTGPTSITAGRATYTRTSALYSSTPASWTDTNITVASGATLNLRVGGTNGFSTADVSTISALGTATGGFQTGSVLGLDTTNGDFTHTGVLANPNGGANSVGLLKHGANNLTLTGTNTYTGTTYLAGGVTVAANTSAFGPAGNSIVLNGTVNLSGTTALQTFGNVEFATDSSVNAYNFTGSSNSPSSITVSRATSGAAVTHLLGQINWGNNILTVQAGTNNASGTPGVSFSGFNATAGGSGNSTLNPTTATIAITGPTNIGGNSFAKTLVLDGTIAGNTISGVISNGINTLSVNKSNTSVWDLSGANTYSGTTTVTAGTLILSGTNTGTGATSIVGGTMRAGASGALNPNSAVTMTDAATAILDLNGFDGTIASLSGGGTLGGNVTLGNGTLTTGDATSTSYSGNITGIGNVIKAGVGTFTLASAQSYTGSTSVNAGTLLANSTLASTTVNVAGGTLGGTGALAGTVTVNAGGMLSPATSTTAGTITLAGLTLNAGSGIAYEFGATNDLVAVTAPNALTINGGALSLFAAGGLTPLTTNGTYTLFSYTTGFGGALANLSVANSQAGKTYSVADAGGTITLTIGTATASEWNGGAADGLWTTAGNWTGGTPNSVGAVATFGTTPATPTTVAVNGPKTVGSIIFDNANSYTVTGGATDTITFDNGIAAGAISTTTGNHTINAPIVLNGPANITPGTGTTLTLGGVITGAKTVTYSGAGTAVVSGTNTYSGGTTLVSGTLSLANGAALGTGTFTINGGTIDAASVVTVTTNNAQVWNGDFTFAGTNSLDLGNGTVSVPIPRTITTTAGTLTVGGSISGSSLTKAGSGTLVLAGNNTYTGTTTLGSGNATAGGGGTLVLAGTNAGTGNVNVGNGATLELRASNALGTLGTSASRVALFAGSTLRLRADSSVTFSGTNAIAGLNTATVSIDVDQLTSAGSNQTLTISPGVTPVGNAVTFNITGGNGYSLGFGTIQNVTGTATNVTLNPTTANVSLAGYNALNNGANSSTLTLGGTTTGNVVTGVIANQAAGSTGTGTTAVVKTGPGTWNLQGANTFTGPITVVEGLLRLTGAKTGASGIITVGNTAGLNATLDITAGTYTIGGAGSRINVGNQATTPATATVNQSGGSVVFTAGGDQVLVGQNTVGNTGIYNLSGGSITTTTSAARGIILGVNPNPAPGTTSGGGIFNLSGTGVINMTAASGGGGDAILQIGRSDALAGNTTNEFNQTGGTANVGILAIGGAASAGSTGVNSTLNLTGGTFAANSFTLLAAGGTNTAIINIGGTANVTLPAFPTARGAGSTATVTFNGGTLKNAAASATYMGGLTNAFIKAGGATFDTTAGNITITQSLLTDTVSTGGGLTKLGTNTLTLTGANTYTGKTVVSAGGLTINSIGSVGGGASAIGAPTTVAEGTIDLAGTLTYTGPAATTDRVFNLSNAAVNVSIFNSGTGLLTLNGNFTGSASNLLFRGAQNITVNGLIPATHTGPVTHTETSTLTLTNAANAFTGALVVSKGTVSVDTIDNKGVASAIGAGTLITLGQSGFNNTGTFQYTGLFGGASDRDIDIQSNAANGNGGIIENTVAGQLLSLSGDITVGGTGTLPTLGLTGAGNGLLSGDILGSSPLAVTKTGTGTWTLSGANTYTGATTVNAGTLMVSGSISGSAVTVNTSATLGGVGGTIGALNVTSGGIVAPGAGIGTLNSSDAIFASNSTFALEINTTTNTTDRLAVTGSISLSLAQDTILSVTDLAASTYNGTPLQFVTYTGAWNGGLFSVGGIPVPDQGTFTVGANTFTLDYDYGGNSIALIPEPGSAALLLGGLAMLGFRRRRRS